MTPKNPATSPPPIPKNPRIQKFPTPKNLMIPEKNPIDIPL
jgi:hypothetical protein